MNLCLPLSGNEFAFANLCLPDAEKEFGAGRKSGDMGMRTPPGAHKSDAPDSVPAREGEASVMSFVSALCCERADDESDTIHMKRWGG